MSHLPQLLSAMSKALGYPTEYTSEAAELLYVVLQHELPEAASEIATFGAFIERHQVWEVEEAYTRIFDINPACSLEVGWHLFGEEYARGMFLVRMRQEMKKYELPESTELPDHIVHVLSVVTSMPEDEATRFVKACVQPAVETMKETLVDQDTPYRHLINALSMVMTYTWGEPVTEEDVDSGSDGVDRLHRHPVVHGELPAEGISSSPFHSDTLHPLTAANAEQASCGSTPDLVQLEIPVPENISGDSNADNQPTTPDATSKS